jgi:OOP family OmpA-OmpF porin
VGSGALSGYYGNDFRAYIGIKIPISKGSQSDNKSIPPPRHFVEITDPAPRPPVAPRPEENLPIISNIEDKVVYEKEKIVITEDVTFDLNKASITPHGRAVLSQVIKVILNNINKIEKLTIKGHTDHLGTDEINLPLSVERTRAVRDYLINYGVPSEVLSAQAYGSQKPIYDHNETSSDIWSQNRRVEFVVKEKD